MVKNTKPKKQAKTKALQSTSGKLKSIWQKNWQAILIAVVFVGILGFVGINQLIIYNQKQQFKAAEESLDSLYAEIVSKVGQPTSSNKDKSCGYSSAKYSKGTRSCGIAYTAYYTIINTPDGAKSFSELTNSVLKNNKNNVVSGAYPGYQTKENEFDTTLSFTFLGNSLDCHASYVLNKDPSSRNQLAFTLDCSGFTKAEFYPVSD